MWMFGGAVSCVDVVAGEGEGPNKQMCDVLTMHGSCVCEIARQENAPGSWNAVRCGRARRANYYSTPVDQKYRKCG